MKTLIAASILVLSLVTPVKAVAQYPLHVSASSPQTISATGYRARIQIRPEATPAFDGTSGFDGTATWAGGFLSDGTFIQSGIAQASPSNGGIPQAFVWFARPGVSEVNIPLTGVVGDWYDFAATLDGGVWTFTVSGPGLNGTVVQYQDAGPSLQVFQVDQETWITSWTGTFPVGVMRYINIRQSGAWSVPHLVFAPPTPPCGQSEIYPTPGLNLVFRPTTGGSPCYVVIS